MWCIMEDIVQLRSPAYRAEWNPETPKLQLPGSITQVFLNQNICVFSQSILGFDFLTQSLFFFPAEIKTIFIPALSPACIDSMKPSHALCQWINQSALLPMLCVTGCKAFPLLHEYHLIATSMGK